MKYSYPTLNTVSLEGRRWYETPAGLFPSITTVLGETAPEESKERLRRWKESLGDRAAEISKEATDHGTNVHLLCERHFRGEDVLAPIDGEPVRARDVMAFNALKIKLKLVEEVWGVEATLFSKQLQLGGRCDAIGMFRGVPCIIDYKTSARIKAREDIEDYFLQLCFYGTAHNEMFGTDIQNGVILMVSDAGFPLEFRVNLGEKLDALKVRAEKFWQDAINTAD